MIQLLIQIPLNVVNSTREMTVGNEAPGQNGTCKPKSVAWNRWCKATEFIMKRTSDAVVMKPSEPPPPTTGGGIRYIIYLI